MKNEQKELLRKIQEVDFAMYELQLFLDTHPNNSTAYMRYIALGKQSKALKDEYETTYGPLTACGVPKRTNRDADEPLWSWISSPWPWEGGNK